MTDQLYFRCAAHACTLSRARCARNWDGRHGDTGNAGCVVCPEQVRLMVRWGTVEQVTAEAVLSGVRPRAVGQAMNLETAVEVAVDVAEQKRLVSVEVASSRRPGSADRRRTAALAYLKALPWRTANDVALAVGLEKNSGWALLTPMVVAGTVQKYRKGGAAQGVPYRFAVVGVPLPDLRAAPGYAGVSGELLEYLGQHGVATAGVMAKALQRDAKHCSAVLRDLAIDGVVRPMGRRMDGIRWQAVNAAEQAEVRA